MRSNAKIFMLSTNACQNPDRLSIQSPRNKEKKMIIFFFLRLKLCLSLFPSLTSTLFLHISIFLPDDSLIMQKQSERQVLGNKLILITMIWLAASHPAIFAFLFILGTSFRKMNTCWLKGKKKTKRGDEIATTHENPA